MKRTIKISLWVLIFLFFIISAAGFLLFNTQFWKATFINSINTKLRAQYGVEIAASRLSGSIFSNLHFEDFRLVSGSNSDLVYAANIDVFYTIPSILSGRTVVSAINLDGISFSYPAALDSIKVLMKNDSIRSENAFDFPRISIRDIVVLDSNNPGEELLSSSLISGNLSIGTDSTLISIDTGFVNLEKIGEDISFGKSDFIISGSRLDIIKIDLKNHSTSAYISGGLDLEVPIQGKLHVALDSVIFSQRIKNIEKILDIDDYLNLNGDIFLTGNGIETDLQFGGKIRKRDISDGSLMAEIGANKIDVTDFSFDVNDEQISGYVRGDPDSGFTANLILERINLNDWNIVTSQTGLNGQMLLNYEGPINNADSIIASVKFYDCGFDSTNFDRIEGDLKYVNGHISVLDTFFLSIDKSVLQLTGQADLNAATIDAKGYFKSQDISVFVPFLRVDTLFGDIDAFVKASGELRHPDLQGWVKGENIGIPQLNFSRSNIRFGIINIDEQLIGDFLVDASDGESTLLQEPVPRLSMDIRLKSDTVFVRSMQVSGERVNLEVSGQVVDFKKFYFDNVEANYDSITIENLIPVHFFVKGDTIDLQNSQFALNNGKIRISGVGTTEELRQFRINFDEIDIRQLATLTKNEKFKSGILNGNIEYVFGGGNPGVNIDLLGKNVEHVNDFYSKIYVKSEVQNNRLNIEKLTIYDPEEGLVRGNGYITCNFPFSEDEKFITGSDSINIQLTFDNFPFSTFSSYVLPNFNKTGRLFGNLQLLERLNTPKLLFDFSLQQPVFDQLSGDILKAHGEYKNSRLIFSDIRLKDKFGQYNGSGYLPFDVELFPLKVTFEEDSLMNMRFSANTKSLLFISEYNALVDEIVGNYNLALSLSGTPKHPIRDGNIIVKDGTVNISSLENSLYGLEGSAVIDNNVMNIVSMMGYMKEQKNRKDIIGVKKGIQKIIDKMFAGRENKVDIPNVSIDGQIDLSKFFKPGFGIVCNGTDIYVRTLLAEQEGLINGTFTVSGRDTIDVDGDIDITEFIIRNEFTGGEELITQEEEGGVYTRINIHAVAPANLYLKNSQLDAELEGEVWIIKNGVSPYLYSGNLEVRKGNFYYYGWEFSELTGSIIFDPTEFNPTLDIQAELILSSYETQTSGQDTQDEYVTVRLTGDLEKPSLQFESDKYSQSDILMILSRANYQEEGSEQSPLGADALNYFGNYLERQLERRMSQIAGLDEFQIRTQGDLLSSQQADQWSVMFGQKLTRNLYVTYERDFSLIESNQQVGIEYRLDRNTSLQANVDENGLIQINYKIKYHY